VREPVTTRVVVSHFPDLVNHGGGDSQRERTPQPLDVLLDREFRWREVLSLVVEEMLVIQHPDI
jgi:hypothetical protein